jgi:hypothetical protein
VKLKPIGGACVIMLIVATVAARPARADSPVHFDPGLWNMSLTGSYINPIRFSDDRLYNITLSGGYYVVRDTSVNLELAGYYAEEPDYHDTVIGGLGILFRTHLLRFDRFTLFIDGGGAVNYAEGIVPRFGTRFNFTAKTGPGITYELKPNLHLIGGARYFHLSNGQIHGRDQNPSYDGVQFWAGMMWTF